MIALDVGYGQLHPKLRGRSSRDRARADERARAGRAAVSPRRCSSATSRSSASGRALPPVLRLLDAGWDALVLVKPQFEAGRADVPSRRRRPRPGGTPSRHPRGRRRGARLGSDDGGRRRLRLARAEGQPRVLRAPDLAATSPCSSMTSTTGSTQQLANRVRRAVVLTHGKPQAIGSALARLATVAREADVELCRRGRRRRRRSTSPSCSAATGRCCGP